MNFNRAWTITLRNLRLVPRDVGRQLGLFFWPGVNMLVWGFLGTWIGQLNSGTHVQNALIASVLLYQIVNRATIELSLTLTEELWSYNLTNIFATPLTLFEWFVGGIMYAGIMMFILALYCLFIVYCVYNTSFAVASTCVSLFMVPLFLCAIVLALITLSIVITFGKQVGETAYVMTWLFAPFCGIFYPREVLPLWAQKIGAFVPMTYVFEAMRELVLNNKLAIGLIMQSVCLCVAYGIPAFFLFNYLFAYSKNKGLVRLSD